MVQILPVLQAAVDTGVCPENARRCRTLVAVIAGRGVRQLMSDAGRYNRWSLWTLTDADAGRRTDSDRCMESDHCVKSECCAESQRYANSDHSGNSDHDANSDRYRRWSLSTQE